MADDSGTIVPLPSTSANIPSGSGSERLRRATVHSLDNGWQNNALSGTAGHIYTILSIVFNDRQSTSGAISIKVNSGSADTYLITGQSHQADGTFVFSDKFVMEEDDDLDVYNSVTNGHWWITYIDQDWT